MGAWNSVYVFFFILSLLFIENDDIECLYKLYLSCTQPSDLRTSSNNVFSEKCGSKVKWKGEKRREKFIPLIIHPIYVAFFSCVCVCVLVPKSWLCWIMNLLFSKRENRTETTSRTKVIFIHLNSSSSLLDTKYKWRETDRIRSNSMRRSSTSLWSTWRMWKRSWIV